MKVTAFVQELISNNYSNLWCKDFCDVSSFISCAQGQSYKMVSDNFLAFHKDYTSILYKCMLDFQYYKKISIYNCMTTLFVKAISIGTGFLFAIQTCLNSLPCSRLQLQEIFQCLQGETFLYHWPSLTEEFVQFFITQDI